MGLPAGVYSPFEISLRDKGGEIGSFGVHGLLLSAANWVANQALAAAFVAAIEGATLGVTVRWQYGNETIVNPVDKASSASAQRENKLLIRYHDVTTLEKMTASIPTISLPALVFLDEANDFVALDDPAFMVALVDAWQDFVVNPRTDNLTLVDSAEFVGRRS